MIVYSIDCLKYEIQNSDFEFLDEEFKVVYQFVCKITNLKKLLGRKFHIWRSIFSTVRKNLTSNLQQIWDTAEFNGELKVTRQEAKFDLEARVKKLEK